jgi:hypothetical protein
MGSISGQAVSGMEHGSKSDGKDDRHNQQAATTEDLIDVCHDAYAEDHL